MTGEVSTLEAARILGVTPGSVYRLVHRGVLHRSQPHARGGLSRDEVEALSLARWECRTAGHPYWMTAVEVAAVLRVTPTQVRSLARRDKLPCLHHGGNWVFRWDQIKLIANARQLNLLGMDRMHA